MNNMNELEKQLLSWTLRRPSARLERRLFAARTAPAEALLPFRLTWLAPATALLMLMCVVFNQRYAPNLYGSNTPGPLVAMILSNQSAAAYLPGSVQAEHNNLPADAFKSSSFRDAVARVIPSSPAKPDDR
jgi:hypothetical protein